MSQGHRSAPGAASVSDAPHPNAFEAFFRSVARLPPPARPLQLRTRATAAQYRRAYALAASYLAGARSVLDWGCGNGHFSRFLLHRGHEVVGYSYEPPPVFVAEAARFSLVPGLAGEPWRLPFQDGAFDAACSIGVLEHVHELGGDPVDSLRELARVLRPGGRLLVVHFPNAGSWIEAAVRLANRLGLASKHQHSRLFSARDVRALFGGAEWVVLTRGRYNILPRNVLGRLPPRLANGRFVCRLVDVADDALSRLLPVLCQNWFVVAEKVAAAGPRPRDGA